MAEVKFKSQDPAWQAAAADRRAAYRASRQAPAPAPAPTTATPPLKFGKDIEQKLQETPGAFETPDQRAEAAGLKIETAVPAGADVTTPEPDTISGAVDEVQQTYQEKAASQFKGSFLEAAETYENIMGKEAPFKTQEEFLEWRANQGQEDLDFLETQQGYSREIEAIQFDQAKKRVAGSVAGVEANMAQVREGAQAGTAPQFTSEFKKEMDRSIEQLSIQKASAEKSRQKALVDLKRAQEGGDLDLAEAIQGKIDGIEQELRAADTRALEIATMANNQALNERKFEHSASMDSQANYRANLNAFGAIVNTGSPMTNEQISGFANSLNVPFEVADSYYQGASMIRDDKSMDQAAKAIALEELAYDFDEKVSGIRGAQAQSVNDFQKLARSGNYTSAQLQSFAVAMNIPNSMNPMYQADLRVQTATALIKDFEAKYLGQPPPEGTKERLEYDKAKLELNIAQAEASEYTGDIPENELASIFDRNYASDYGHGVGKAECGEGYNDLTTGGAKVGDDYSTKMAIVTKRSSPQTGNAVVFPLGGTGNPSGHIGTVLRFNPITQSFKTVEWNHNGDGKQTFEEYTIEEMNSKYGNNWGFSDSKLKPAEAKKFQAAQDKITNKKVTFEDSPDWFQNMMTNDFVKGGQSETDIRGMINRRTDIGDSQKKQYVALFDRILNETPDSGGASSDIFSAALQTSFAVGKPEAQTWQQKKTAYEGGSEVETETPLKRDISDM